MTSPTVAVVNPSTVVTYAALGPVVEALQIQATRDFGPAWGVYPTVYMVPQGSSPKPGEWVLGIFDDSSQAGVLGYHDVTSSGQPLGKVFAKTTMADGLKWSVTASHELLEMLADPDIDLLVLDRTTKGVVGIAYEACDPCEEDSQGYTISTSGGVSVAVSDFVLPAYFTKSVVASKYDFMGHITVHFQILAGGYIGEYIWGQGWTQKTHDGVPNWKSRGMVGSRRERRTIFHADRIRSTAV